MAGESEPDPATARTPAEFIARLTELRTWAGKPSLRLLQRLAGQTETAGGDLVDALPPSTLSYVLTGKGLPALPRLAFVDAFVTACLTACEVPVPERLARWRSAWRTLARASEHGAHHQLPMDIGEFTGRAAELARLRSLARDRDPHAVTVVSIEGMAGVGKTRLAVHAAHELSRPHEVQLWSDLRGFDPDQPPADPAEVLAAFLRLLGVPGARIPENTAERAMLYRARLAGRRGLVLLDNAATAEQVRPLLPGDPGYLVLVTSRLSMAGLDGVHRLPLDVFSLDETVELLSTVAGRDRVAASPDGARRVAELCGYLPILLALAARRLRSRPAWTLAELADRLAAGEGSAELERCFALSYRSLASPAQRLFRLLGTHPGTDFTAASAAALAGLPVPEAGALAEELLDGHLLQQQTAGRYRFHDLLREYAGRLVSASEAHDALRRCVTWLLHSADRAVQALEPHRRRTFTLSTCDSPPASFGTAAEALAWCETERANLVAAVHAAARAGLTTLSWQLPAVLLRFFYLRSHWADWLATHRLALSAVRTSHDRRGEATILNGLGVAYGDLRRYPEAIEHCTAAASLFRSVGDAYGQAWSLNNVGVSSIDHQDPATAVAHFHQALALFRDIGDPQGEAISLNNLGDGYRRLGQPDSALEHLHQALATSDQASRRYTLATLGDVYRDTARHAEAVSHYEQALAAHRKAGDRRSTARTLHSLGTTFEAMGDPEAQAHLREAREIRTELGDPEAS